MRKGTMLRPQHWSIVSKAELGTGYFLVASTKGLPGLFVD